MTDDPMTTATAAMFMRQRDEAIRLAGVLYNALLVNEEAWRTVSVSNGATRSAESVTASALSAYRDAANVRVLPTRREAI